jgi:hypothetical protein
MRLSPLTQEILRNLSGVASDEKCCPLVVYPGNKLWAISSGSNLLAYAEVEEEWPHFGIFDLRSFIVALSIFKDPEIDIQERQIIISDGTSKEMRYPTCNLGSIKSPHDQMTPEQIAFLFSRTEEEYAEAVEFELSWSNILNAQKAASVLATIGDKSFYYIISTDRNDIIRFGCGDGKTTNKTFFVEVGKSPVKDFTVFVQRDTFIKLLSREHKIRAMSGLILLKSNDITYLMGTAARAE